MAYQATHPVEIGTYGKFKYGWKGILEQWAHLEGAWIDTFECPFTQNQPTPPGPSTPATIVRWAFQNGLINKRTFETWQAAI